MIGHNRPSIVLNTLYDIIENYEVGIELYNDYAFPAVQEYLNNNQIPYQAYFHYSSDNTCQGTWYISFVDNGYPFLLVLDIK